MVQKNQKENTSLFKNMDITDVAHSCGELGNLFDLIQTRFGVVIFKLHLLRQSRNGKNGAKEALFYWHKDNINKEKALILL